MEKKEIEALVREVLRTLEQKADFPAPGGGGAVSRNTAAGAGQAPRNLPLPSVRTGSFPGILAEGAGGMVQTSMPLALAVELMGRVEARAAEQGMRVVSAVSDASGRPVAVHCMDGAYMGSFDLALNKAYTAIAFQMSTARLGNLSLPGEELYGIQQTNQGRIVILGGGELLLQGGVIVGALGVSGGSAREDTDLAAYGSAVFEEVVKCL